MIQKNPSLEPGFLGLQSLQKMMWVSLPYRGEYLSVLLDTLKDQFDITSRRYIQYNIDALDDAIMKDILEMKDCFMRDGYYFTVALINEIGNIEIIKFFKENDISVVSIEVAEDSESFRKALIKILKHTSIPRS